MTKYLITYQFKSEEGKLGWGNMEIEHKSHFKDPKELEETKKIIEKEGLNGIDSKVSLVILNIIKFPIK